VKNEVLKIEQKNTVFANFVSKAEVLDTNNHITGEFNDKYSTPILIKCNVKKATGTVFSSPFGTAISYQYCFLSDDPDLPITEQSIIWYGSIPPTPYVSDAVDNNCRVKLVSRSKNKCLCYFEKI